MIARQATQHRYRQTRLVAIGLFILAASVPGHAQPSGTSSDPLSIIANKANVRITPRCVRDQPAQDEIVVCGARSEAERQRLPRIFSDRFDPNGPIDSVSRERHSLYEVGDAGIGSCSTSGPGGMAGCDFKRFKQRLEQHGK